jgi:hypothetical protein
VPLPHQLAAVAFAAPGPGASAYSDLNEVLIVLLFLILGLTLKITEFRAGLAAVHVHLMCQVCSVSIGIHQCSYFWEDSLASQTLQYLCWFSGRVMTH